MQTYLDLDRDSGIAMYEIGSDYIKVLFNDGKPYVYTYASAGVAHVEAMKKLAVAGNGLNSYINRFVKYLYAR